MCGDLMQTSYAIWIAYDGTAYSGWQRQNNAKSIQAVIEKELSLLLKTSITIHASGRTDAGVHAYGQCASFKARALMPVDKLKFALSNRMPEDISIVDIKEVPDAFHARYSAIGKTYEYHLYVSQNNDPFKNRYASRVKYPLNEVLVREAMRAFLGTHNFVGFMASGSHVQNTIRTIHSFDLEIVDNNWKFTISGDGFLYNMVRIIIGLLIRVGEGHIKPDTIASIINSQNRSLARWTAPPNGLFLKTVFYPQNSIEIEDNY